MDKSDWRTALRADGEASVCIDLYIEPGSSGQAVGPYDPWRQRVHVSVKAPALDGKANVELVKVLSSVLDIPSATIRIVRGATTRRKTVRAEGIGLAEAIESLSGHLDEEGEHPG